jgi:hypothetical protein
METLLHSERVSLDDSTDPSLAEEERGMMSVLTRQFLHTHRPFRAVIMDRTGQPVLWVSVFRTETGQEPVCLSACLSVCLSPFFFLLA